MTDLDNFRAEGTSLFSVDYQFRLNQKKQPNNDIHAFFEGLDDPSFYMNFLHRFSKGQKIHSYCCKDKKGVYDAYREISEIDHHAIKLFFVDKDHSDILNEKLVQAPNIYVTDLYSIENYLVSVYMLERIWEEVFELRDIMELDSRHYAKFEEELRRFYEFATPLMAWIICLRRQGKSPIIKNIAVSKLFNITKELTIEWKIEVQQVSIISFLEVLCKARIPEKGTDDLNLIIAHELLNLNPKAYIRGKLELDFLIQFMRTFLDSLVKSLPLNSESERTKRRLIAAQQKLTGDNAVKTLGPRALIPPSLEEFLQKHLSFLSREKKE